MQCKGVGSKNCGKSFETYNELMDHRRDEHNSGNVICRYFKEGSCQFMDDDKGGCWYLHKKSKANFHGEESEIFDCTSCENTFKTKPEIMMHRKKHHKDEVPECNSISKGKKCFKTPNCWFRHPKSGSPVLQLYVLPSNFQKQKTTADTNQGFLARSPYDKATGSNGKKAGNDDNSNDRSSRAKEIASSHGIQLNLNKDRQKNGQNNNITIVRSNKLIHALDLPTVLNLNP